MVTPLQNTLSHHYNDVVTSLQARRRTLQRGGHTVTKTLSHSYKEVVRPLQRRCYRKQ
jgi:hypothetical protein